MKTLFTSYKLYAPLANNATNIISVEEAKQIIKAHVAVLPAKTINIKDAVGYVLAEDVYSAIDFPPFNQSNVDGYAIAFEDTHEKLAICGESAAGNKEALTLHPKQALRIFTGAPVPFNADTVVMQEKVIIENGFVIIKDDKLQKGLHFRAKGKDIQRGSVALKKNEHLSAGAIGFLNALGVTEVCVYGKPCISIIITGNELQQPGKPLQFGQVYESNSLMLRSVLQQLHFDNVEVYYADDNLEKLISTLQTALSISDIVLLCGGISVGDYDLVLKATENCSVEKLFHKVKQTPGKPLYFGKKDKKLVFGLPGNPSSVLTCFYEYVAEALAIMMNRKSFLKKTISILQNDFTKAAGLTFFLKGLLEDDKVFALDAQESYRLSSYARANCLIKLDEKRTNFKAGEEAEVHIF